MALTPKQELFAQCVANGKSQSDAYRAAYNVGEDTEAQTVWVNASILAAATNVSQRIKQLKADLVEQCLWTREDSVIALVQGVVRAEGTKQTDLINAIKELNVMHGYKAPEKHEINGIIQSITRKIVDPKGGGDGA